MHIHFSTSSEKKATKASREVYTPPAKRNKISSPPQSQHDSSSNPSPSNSETETKTRHQSSTHRTHHHRKDFEPRKIYQTDATHYGRERPPDRRFPNQDRKRDPSKWTKYDLKDVGTSEMSGMTDEQVNRHAAYQFLDDLKQQRQTRENDEGDMTGSKVVFKKPTRRAEKDSRISPTNTHSNKMSSKETMVTTFTPGSSIRTLPEYVVGVKTVISRNRPGKRVPQLTLSSDDVDMENENGTENNTSSEYGMDPGHSLRGSNSREKNGKVSKKSSVTLSHLEDED